MKFTAVGLLPKDYKFKCKRLNLDSVGWGFGWFSDEVVCVYNIMLQSFNLWYVQVNK